MIKKISGVLLVVSTLTSCASNGGLMNTPIENTSGVSVNEKIINEANTKDKIAFVIFHIKQKAKIETKALGEEADHYRFKIIGLDSVFSLDQTFAKGDILQLMLLQNKTYKVDVEALLNGTVIATATIDSLAVTSGSINADLVFQPVLIQNPSPVPLASSNPIPLGGVTDQNVPIPEATPYIKVISSGGTTPIPTSTPTPIPTQIPPINQGITITTFAPADILAGETVTATVNISNPSKVSDIKAVLTSGATIVELPATFENDTTIKFIVPEDYVSAHNESLKFKVTSSDGSIVYSNEWGIDIYSYSSNNLTESTTNNTGTFYFPYLPNGASDLNINSDWISDSVGSGQVLAEVFSRVKYINRIVVKKPNALALGLVTLQLETSIDGSHFDKIVENQQINFAYYGGYVANFVPQRAKYIRVTMSNVLNLYTNMPSQAGISEIETYLTK